MFIDETGRADIELDEPFTLTGVIFEYRYAIDQQGNKSNLKCKLNKLKLDSFGTEDIDIHLTDISRKTKSFENMETSKIKSFYENLPGFLSALDCNLISITIDKNKLKTYYEPSKDPYVIAFTHILQNFYSFINKDEIESARIVIESRDDASNLKVQKAFFDVFNNGTIHLEIEDRLRDKIKGFIIAKKTDSEYKCGLEIADLVCNPLSRARRGLIEANPKCFRYGKENKIFTALKEKIYSPTNIEDIRNWGFKKVPIVKSNREWNDNPSA